jgi:hypothetical protein
VIFEKTAGRVWKHLTREERLGAARAFWREPPQDVLGAAFTSIVKARRMRPQVVRALSDEAKSETLASILEPGEPLAAALLVALHLGERRPLLVAFLDAVGLPHENGLIKEDPVALVGEGEARAGIRALGAFPRRQIETYLNTLWLQDPERWEVLPRSSEAEFAGSGNAGSAGS